MPSAVQIRESAVFGPQSRLLKQRCADLGELDNAVVWRPDNIQCFRKSDDRHECRDRHQQSTDRQEELDRDDMNHYGERGESHDSPSFSFLSPLDDDTDEEHDDSSSRIPPPIMLQSASSPPSLTASSSTSSPSSFLPPPSSIYVRRCDSSYSSIRGQNKSSDSRSTTFRIEKPTLFRTVKPTSDRINHISNERTRFWPGFRGETSRDPEQRIERVQKLRLPHSEDSEERFQVNESANFRNIAVNPVDEPIYSCPCGHDLSPDDLEEIAVSRLLGQKRKRDDSQEKDEDSHHEVSNEYPPPKRLRVETWGSWIAGLFELV